MSSKCLINFILLEDENEYFDEFSFLNKEKKPRKKRRVLDSMKSKCYFLSQTSEGYVCSRDENRTILAKKVDDLDYGMALITTSQCPLQQKKKVLSK